MAGPAEVDIGNSCGYVEEITVAGSTAVHRPRKAGDTTGVSTNGVVVSRKYCILRTGHSGGHSYR